MVKRLTTDEFVAKAHKVHGGAYSYEKAVYETKKSIVTVTCPKHGDYNVTAVVHLLGFKCKKCANEEKSKYQGWLNKRSDKQRLAAKDKKEMFYDGSFCKKCGNQKRYVCSGQCTVCSVEQRKISNAKNHAIRQKRVKQANIYYNNFDIQNEIKNIYKCAKKSQDTHNVSINVDHIVPLKGKDVCGLHVPWNLMICTARFNRSKKTKMLEINSVAKQGSVIVHQSALPWNLKKEHQNASAMEHC